MKIVEEDVLLRVFLSEETKHHGKCVYRLIMEEAQKLDLAGATLLRGLMGFGADHHVHSSGLLELSHNLPVVVEIVDKEEHIKKIMPYLDEVVEDGFLTVEKVQVIRYRKNR